MKHIVIVAAGLLVSTGVLADGKSNALLGSLQQKVASWGDYRVEFTVTIDGQSLTGSYEVSGESYHVTTPDIELFCDGKVKYEVNKLDSEVVVDRVDPADRTVMGNPTRLFDFMDGSYTHRYMGAAMVDGTNCERIELRETAATTGAGNASMGGASGSTSGSSASSGAAQTIHVFISKATGLPVRVGYTIGLMNTEAAVDVVRITPRVALDASFRYDPKRYANYETIDFR